MTPAAMSMPPTPGDAVPVRIDVRGGMTIYEAAGQKAQMLAALAAACALELDLGEVDEADTAGVQLLLLLRREGARAGKPVRVLRLSPAVAEVLERYGLDTGSSDLPPL